MINEIGEKESYELLRKQSIGRLGCCENGEPYVVPINYWFDDGSIYVHALPGHKIEIMRANPRVCLQTDEIKDAYNWRSVIAFGWFEEINDPAQSNHIMSEMFKKLPHLSPVESKAKDALARAIVFRIRIERVTGVAERWQ
jgi:nitroimidazol reductase NimA-like FMN-containing flavoprotein (pyridoxamine 5'-phosphate oxidase superfamily)